VTADNKPDTAIEEIAALASGTVDSLDDHSPPPSPGMGAAPEDWQGEDEGGFYDDDAPPADFDPVERSTIAAETIAANAAEPQNDTGNGQRLLRYFGGELLNVRELSSDREPGWHYYDGQRWQREGGNERAMLCAQRAAPRIQLEADFLTATPAEARAIERAIDAAAEKERIDRKPAADRTDADKKRLWTLDNLIDAGKEAEAALQKRQINRRKFAVSSGNGSKLREMLKAMLPHRTAATADMDKDPYAFNCANGTLRFECYDVPDLDCPDPAVDRRKPFWAARLDAHDAGDLITKLSPVDYKPDARCPIFLQSIARFQPNAAKREFLQKYAGYALTGLNGEQCLLFSYGGGSNWKSTFIEIVSRIMGDYAEVLKFESLAEVGQTTGAQANPDFARLPGVRLVRVTEAQRGLGLNEGLIKSLTSGEPWLTRHNFGNFFSFYPSFKFALSGNTKPEIGGVDHGIWRRIRFMIWPVTIADDERRDMDDVMAELWAERDGILAWLVDGALKYLNDGLVPPQEILDETEEYREEQDVVGQFLRACVTMLPPDDKAADPPGVPAQDMFEAFERWCGANGHRAWKQRAFGQALTTKGFVRDRKSTLRRYLWVQLHDVPAAKPHGNRREQAPHPADSTEEIPD
jgi:putative DNA primase/helicase